MTVILSNVHNLHLKPSNRVHFNSNDLNKLKCAQLALNTFRLGSIALKCAQPAFNTLELGPLTLKWPQYPQMYTTCTQHPQIKYSSSQMTTIPSNVHICTPQPQIRPSYTQMTFNTLKNYTSALNQIKSTLTNSNMQLYTSNAPISKPPTSKHQPMLQTSTNATPTQNTGIALMSTKTLKIHSLINKQSKL